MNGEYPQLFDTRWQLEGEDPRINGDYSDTELIILTSGGVAIIDAEDYDSLNIYKWHMDVDGYARRSVNIGGKRTKTILMHRAINQTPKSKITDHINGDRLDNRKGNLRTATSSQNIAHRIKPTRNKCGYFGVSKKDNRWQADGRDKDGKTKYLGLFKTPTEAARARDVHVKELHGEFAVLNFPREVEDGPDTF